ncbi:Endonuclease/exonuclease/phosphatase [Emericellopsis atlantica]|uniref:Endonuclease/exonuclease/phosphatase n=1 Tax=Emericellopsis atlantica TaxID=2614577 RepID=A0A9P7ZJP1_9HYPO|nr:Endonuclease/exonuclease/phosphatase [Emericellopsis atlantica]KAG9252951.1 Endonuclease/exonuclease/phosphatase [Emericellopsis atlantica]
MAEQSDSLTSEPVDLANAATATPQSLAKAVHARRSEYTRRHQIKVKIGSWNVAACPGTDKDLARWFVDGEGLDQQFATLNLRQHAGTETTVKEAQGDAHDPIRLVGGEDVGLYILGLQEVVDLNLTKEYMARAVYTDNSATQKWQAALEAAMPAGYTLVSVEQMFGLLQLVYASPELAPTIGNVCTRQVGTGIGGWFANKGAVATRLILGETTRMVFVNCHLASGETTANLDRRCADAKQIVAKTQFDPVVQAGVEEDEGEGIGAEDFAFWFGDLNYRLDGLPGDDIRRLLTLHTQGEYDLSKGSKTDPPEGEGVIVMRSSEDGDDTTTTSSSSHSRDQSLESESSLPDPDDFPEDPSQDPTSLQATLDSLLPHDQLRRVIRERKAFHDGWREGPITFLPTYKYDVGSVGLFDSSEKQRAPSWCDRILYRTRRDKEEYEAKNKEEEEAKKKDTEMKLRGIEDDEDVLFTYDPGTDGESPSAAEPELGYDEYDENEDEPEPDVVTTKDGYEDHIKLDIYTSHQGITSSDHKPVVSLFTLDYDAVVPELKSKVHAEVAKELDRAENEGRPGITVIAESGKGADESAIDFGEIQFLERKLASVTIANTSGVSATFGFVEKPQHGGREENMSDRWTTTSFAIPDDEDTESEALGKSVTLEPGETLLAHVNAYVSSIPLLQSLNNGSAKLEDVLVLRVDDGRDHFIPIRASWQPSCFGRSVDELIRVPDGGIRSFVKQWAIEGSIPSDTEQKFSAPQELFKITTAMEDLAERCIADEAMLDEVTVPKAAGWPLEASTWTAPSSTMNELSGRLVTALDMGESLIPSLPVETSSAHKLEALSSILLLFLSSLTDGIIPYHLWLKVETSLATLAPAKPPDAKQKLLDTLTIAPSHNIAFVFLTTALSRIATELTPPAPASTPAPVRRLSFRKPPAGGNEAATIKGRRAKERKFSEIVAPMICRSTEANAAKDKHTKERERAMIEVCVRAEDAL